jgi:two-component system, sensor histidine kinase RegB
MKSSHHFGIDAPTQHLRQLTIIRSLLLCFFWCSFIASFWVDSMQLPYGAVAIVLCALSAIHAYTYLRLKRARAVTQFEFFIQLLLDILCLNLLFYFSGGATNPFISYLLVPVCISAATLPWHFTWFITALCVIAYSVLLFFHVSLPIFVIDHAHGNAQLSWHVIGMWFNFFISAALITYFVVKMARSLRHQETMLNQLREDELRNEQVIAVATLAAGAAHDINTPLSTMTVLLSELRDEYKNSPSLLTDLTLLSQQVAFCASSLKQMVQDASAATQGQLKPQTLKNYCNSIIDRWQLMRPAIQFTTQFSEAVTEQSIAYDSRLDFAIINLLNNAADASPQKITLVISTDKNFLYWKIIDEGNGIDHALARRLGKEPVSTKTTGLGLGMLLSHATINRYGGQVIQTHNAPQGTVTDIILPIV